MNRNLTNVPKCTPKESANISEEDVKVPTIVAPRPPAMFRGLQNARSTAVMAICATAHKAKWPAPLS